MGFYATVGNRFYQPTITNIGTDVTDSRYPVGNLDDFQIAAPWKTTTGTHQMLLQFDFGAAIALYMVALFNHNVTGTTLTLFGNSSPSWSSPPFGVNFTIGSFDHDFYYPNTFVDLSAAPQTYRYWLLASGAANGTTLIANAPWAMGEVWFLNAFNRLTNDFQFPFTDERIRDGASIQYARGGSPWAIGPLSRRRRFTSTLDGDDAINAAEVANWWKLADGPAKPTIFGTDLAVPDCRLAYHAAPYAREVSTFGRNVQQVDLIEVAQGTPNFLLGF